MIILKNFRISIISPHDILIWASKNILGILYVGEVYRPETINFITGTPFIGGLFCEKIFGPIISWQCQCMGYKLYKYICFICGSEINTANIRKFRMGVIYLQTPLFNLWYYNSNLSILPVLLDINREVLINLIYYKYCKIFRNNVQYFNLLYKTLIKLQLKQIMYINIIIHKYLIIFNIIENIIMLKEFLLLNKINHILICKKLFFLNLFFFNKLKLSWLLLNNFPIIPPNLRPIVKLNKNNFIVSKLNYFYKNILIHNNRLKNFMISKKKISLIFKLNEKIQLQQSVDLILNKNVSLKNVNFILKSLAGKYGKFRQNLLGKRIDYSSRSVIISGPDLNFSKVGVPLGIACSLFSPILINILKKYKTLKYIISNSNYIHLSILYRRLLTRLFKTKLVLLNRAPTLHRVNIQGFKPYLIDGRAIKLYPLVCSSFNADFDGDQMSILITLTKPSRLEAKYILSSDKNFLSLPTGLNLFKLNQTFLLGLFFISTLFYEKNKIIYLYFNTLDDILIYHAMGLLDIQTLVWVKLKYIYKAFIYTQFKFFNVGRIILSKSIYVI